MKITNHLNAGGFQVQNLADATSAQDAVTKAQLDAAIQGFKWKDPVRVATTGNITLSGLQTLDGVSVTAGQRVLVKNQTSAQANGIYVAASGAWTRAGDFDAASEVVGATVYVAAGTVAGGSQWHMGSAGPITVGTTPMAWTQVAGGVAGASYTAGDGITLAGNVIALDPAVAARKASALVGDGTATTLTLTHNLNTQDVVVSVREVSTNAGVLCDWVANAANTVQLTFGAAPSTGQYRVTVVA